MSLPEPSQQHSCYPRRFFDFRLERYKGKIEQQGFSWPRCARCGMGPRGDGWVPYGLPQLPLLVQLALQAARTLFRSVRLLLQAPDLSPHRLQRAATGHGQAVARLRSVSTLCSCYCCFCCCSYRAQVRRVPLRPALQCRRPLRPRSSPEVTASGPQRAAGGCARAEDGRGWQAGGAPRTPGNRQLVEPLRLRAGTGGSGLLRQERGHRWRAFASTPPPRLDGPK